MVKALQSPYRPGRHSKDWLKLKRTVATIDVIVTAVEALARPEDSLDSSDSLNSSDSSGNLPIAHSSFSIAVRTSRTDPTLLNIGKVSEGLEPTQQMVLADWVDQHTLEEFAEGRVCLVEPQIVLEVAVVA